MGSAPMLHSRGMDLRPPRRLESGPVHPAGRRLAVSAGVAGWGLAALMIAGCGRAPAPSIDPDAVPDAYAVASGALMAPGTTRAWQVTGSGNLYNGAWRLRISPSAGKDTADSPRRIAAEDRWMPVLHWTRRSGSLRWDFSAAALAEPAPRDSELIVSLQIRVTNQGPAGAPARLELALEPNEPRSSWVAWDGTVETPRWNGGSPADTVHAWTEGGAGGAIVTQDWTLGPGETRTLRVALPSYPSVEPELRRFAARSHDDCTARVREFWHRELKPGMEFSIGDPEVENALRAATVTLLSLRERRGTYWVPIGGPFQYRDVWLRDGARAIAALAEMGHTGVARELARGFLLLQWPNGAFLSQRGQLDGTGQALWAFEQAWLRPPGAGKALEPIAGAAVAATQWYALQRDLGTRIGGTFPQLLPFAEPRDGELTRAQLVGNDAWAIAGLRAASRLLAAAGRADEARQAGLGAEAWRAAFAEALHGHPDLPPSWQGVGRDWGNFAVAWPCAALPPGDPRVAAFARRVWAAGGGAGLTFYSHPDSLHGYLGADLATWAMLAGRRAQADSVLAAHLHWRTAAGTAAELFDRDGRFGGNLPPHPTSAAALVMLVRNALVYDDDDSLRLTLGARERWWKSATLRRVPTRWGTIDLEFSTVPGHARWKWTPVPAWTSLTLPPGRVLAEPLPAPYRGEVGDTIVWAPPGSREMAVALREASQP